MAYLFFGLTRDAKLLPSALLNQAVPNTITAGLSPEIPPISPEILHDNQKYKIINVFASWCQPCRAEHSYLMALKNNPNLIILGINWQDTPQNALKFLGELGNPYQNISLDNDGKYGVEWGVYGVPESFLVNREGVIIWKNTGPLNPEIIATKLLPLIK